MTTSKTDEGAAVTDLSPSNSLMNMDESSQNSLIVVEERDDNSGKATLFFKDATVGEPSSSSSSPSSMFLEWYQSIFENVCGTRKIASASRNPLKAHFSTTISPLVAVFNCASQEVTQLDEEEKEYPPLQAVSSFVSSTTTAVSHRVPWPNENSDDNKKSINRDAYRYLIRVRPSAIVSQSLPPSPTSHKQKSCRYLLRKTQSDTLYSLPHVQCMSG